MFSLLFFLYSLLAALPDLMSSEVAKNRKLSDSVDDDEVVAKAFKAPPLGDDSLSPSVTTSDHHLDMPWYSRRT